MQKSALSASKSSKVIMFPTKRIDYTGAVAIFWRSNRWRATLLIAWFASRCCAILLQWHLLWKPRLSTFGSAAEYR